MSTQTLRTPGEVRQARHEWSLVVAVFVALLLVFAVLVGLATVNSPSKTGSGGSNHGSKSVSHQSAVVRVGGDGHYQYHPLP